MIKMKYLKICVAIFVLFTISCQKKKEVSVDYILSQIAEPVFPDYEVVINDTLGNTKVEIEEAIEELSKLGGGKLKISKGTYHINGPIHLLSNINLHLEKGAILKFSSEPKDYLPAVFSSWEGTFLYNYSPFIYAYQCENIAITGEGVIDGEASDSWQKWKSNQKKDQLASREMNHKKVPFEDRVFGDGHFLRPHLIQFFDSKIILIEGVTIEDSPFWCIHLLKCENAVVRGVKYHAYNKNNDGIDLEYSKNILIEEVVFDNGDDNVAIKAGRDAEGRATQIPSENIVIRNCSFKGLHAVVMGSEMSSGIQNVFVENCSSHGYLKRGIYLKSNPDRGGFIRDIYVNNISFNEVEDCFYITSFYHSEGEGHETEITNIYTKNVTCSKVNGTGIVIQGFSTKKVRDVYFKNLKIDTCENALSMIDAENIVFSDVVIGNLATAPSYVK